MTIKGGSPSYEKAVCPHCGEVIYVRYQREPQVRILGLVDTDGVMTETTSNPDIDAIYNFWNSQHIIVHRDMTRDIAKAIRAELKNYSEIEILQAIKNYAEIQKGEQYWFKYAWTLRDFLKRGVPKFMDLEIAKKNYLTRENAPKERPSYKECKSCGYKALTSDTYCPKCTTHLSKDYTAGKYAHMVQR